ncbi:MAG: hypothetical protein H6667_19895 [Ardenticatenaceae bacterium]|nr:hypothetical protein [Ardenticatenaceae bacterium]MCB9443911.1 hypothetical protein [Ardenticatenaceae bacterium]
MNPNLFSTLLNAPRPLPWVTLLGLDGSGKSTVLETLEEQLQPLAITVIHRRPGVVYRTGQSEGGAAGITHYGKPAHGPIKSVLKLLAMVLDWHIGYWRTIRPARRRGELVITDRHALLDLIADPLRYRYGGPVGLVYWAIRLAPRPQNVFLLDAPIAVLQARKQELSVKKAEELRAAYLQLLQKLPNGRVIDASQPIDQVMKDIVSHLVLQTE